MKTRFKGVFVFAITICVLLNITSCSQTKKMEKMEKELRSFIEVYEEKVVPLYTEAALAYFTAAVSGKEEDYLKYQELSIDISKIHADKEAFAQLKRIKESALVQDSLLLRQMEVLYTTFLGSQIDEEKLEAMIKLSTEVSLKYNTFRTIAGTDTLTDNQIEEILKSVKDSEQLREVWLAHKEIGHLVADDVKRLVKMRNEAAHELGFNNFHEMSLKLSEQDPEEILQLFDELDELTKNAYVELKGEIDEFLATRYAISKDELMPWHYQNRFFQEAPVIYQIDLDKYYKDKDLVELTVDYFRSIGLEIQEMVDKSDLFEKPGKNQHAFCINIDRKGDVRVLCNIKPNSYWMNTMLHEYGHAVYDKYIDMNLPYVLRRPAHTFTTEAIAMLFGRFSSNPRWLHDMGLIDEEEMRAVMMDSYRILRLEMMVFSRWSQVMYRFEKSMYENPDQDLNALWWDLVEKYQMMKRPENRNAPDWATKIHIATSPCYYHNYLMGELLASQFYMYLVDNVIEDSRKVQSFFHKPDVGHYLMEKVFAPGKLYPWNEMIEKATGEKLTPKYYAEQWRLN